MSASTPSQKLRSVQALRGIAALLVLVFHLFELQRLHLQASLQPEAASATTGALSGPWTQGYAGVDLFFVISGFIMVYITAHRAGGASDVWSFVKSRVRRIYPLWWILSAVLMLYYFAVYGAPVDASRVSEGGYVSFTLKSLWLLPQSVDPLIGQGWSLVHEMYFYAVFALLMFLPAKWRLRLLTVWGAVTAAVLLAGFGAVRANDYVSLIASAYTFEFLAGALAGWLVTSGRIVAPRLCLFVGLGTAIIALVAYTDKSAFMMQYGRMAVFTVPFTLMIYGAAGAERLGLTTRLWPPWLVRVGDWSYALYLSHVFILGVIIRLMHAIAARAESGLLKMLFDLSAAGPWSHVLFVCAGLVGSVLGAGLIYYAIERPLMRRKFQA